VCDFFVLYYVIFYFIQNCEYWQNLFFEITFGWFWDKIEKLDKTCVEFEFKKPTQTWFKKIIIKKQNATQTCPKGPFEFAI
jgi:hypothetical protein